MAPLTVNLRDPIAKFLLLISVTFCFADFDVFVPEKEMLPPDDSTMILLNRRLILRPGYLEHLMTHKEENYYVCWSD